MTPDRTILDELRIDRATKRRSGPSIAIVAAILLIAALVVVLIWWSVRPKPVVVRTVAVREVSSAGKAVSEVDLDRADAQAKALRARLVRQNADVSVAERDVEMWKQQLDDNIIRAPFAGVVTTKNAQPGEMISPMSVGGFTRTGICTIVDMSSLEIEVDVSESYINRVTAGQPVEATLDSYPSWKIPAKVIAIIPSADRQKATVKVRVGFDKLD